MSHATSSRPADRNLLFGVLALQLDFVKDGDFIAAMHAWARTKHKSLGQILCEHGALAPDENDALEALVEKHIRRHQNDPSSSLAAVPLPARLRESMRMISDSDVQDSLVSSVPLSEAALEHTTIFAPAAQDSARYRVLRPHARGGLGQVSVALDTELHREVAFKEILPDYAHDPHNRSRFILEAEVNGRLEHPHIVPVYGMGQHADGRPFYAMRFIQGQTLRDAIRDFHDADVPGRHPGERALALRHLLNSFVAICKTVGYAHSRGVLHRDIKPANILLGSFGETLLLDWGLAKVVGRGEIDSGETTLRPSSGSDLGTQIGSALGTPAYMSPEQAMGRLDQVRQQSDIYTLGATLYSILTGRPPIDGADAREILEKAARCDWVPPAQVKRGVPAALAAICARAMAMRPEDRYALAASLGADVERWLADEPVDVYAEPWHLRLRRWLSRHRTVATATAAALGVTVVTLALATLLLKRAGDRERLARQGESTARRRAEENFKLARDAVDSSLTKVSDNPQLKAAGLEPLRRELLQQARDFYEKFVKAQSDVPGLQAERGQAYLRLAEINGLLGSISEAIGLARQAQKIFSSLANQSPDVPEYKDRLAAAFSAIGRHEYLAKQMAEAEVPLQQALALRERLVRIEPSRPDYRLQFAKSSNDMGELLRLGMARATEGEAFYNQALSLCLALDRDFPGNAEYQSELARTLHHLAESESFRGQPRLAIDTFEKALTVLERLAEVYPEVASYQDQLGVTLHDLAVQHNNLRQPLLSRSLAERARGIYERLIREHPLVPAYQAGLSRARAVSAGAVAQLGDHARAAAEAEAVASAKGSDGESLYNAACVYTLSSDAALRDEKAPPEQRRLLADRYAARAVEMLRKADETGWFQIEVMFALIKDDQDLNSLRERDDFKKLLRELENKAKKRR